MVDRAGCLEGGRGFSLFRLGESHGARPTAVCPSTWTALVLAAVLPGTGRDPLLRLRKGAGAEGFYLATLDTCEVVAQLKLFAGTKGCYLFSWQSVARQTLSPGHAVSGRSPATSKASRKISLPGR